MHIRILLNSIALDPNRWTDEKVPFYQLDELLEPVANSGFRGVEVWQHHVTSLDDAALTELRTKADDLGLDFPVLGIYPNLHLGASDGEEALADSLRLLDVAATLGANTVKLFVGSKASYDLTEMEEANTVASLETLAEAAEDRDLLLAGETHANTLFDSVETVKMSLQEIDRDDLEVCFQPFDSKNTEQAIADYTALADHVIHVHLQGRKDDQMSLLEEADIDYERFLETLEINGFAGYLSIEFVKDCVVDHPEDFDLDRVLANATIDREFVEKVLEIG
jgi:sugar phosphate isomerase/epimerase